MTDIDALQKMAKRVEFWQGTGIKNGYGTSEDVTKAWGYDENGELLFSAEYDTDGNFRLSLLSGKNGELKMCEDLYSDDLGDATLSSSRKQKLEKAKQFVGGLKERNKGDKCGKAVKNLSLNELLLKGITVELSDRSRLSFAPDIENLRISKDNNGGLQMSGMSKDGKQRIDFSFKDGIAQFELHNGDIARAYNNKIGGKWTWRDLKSPTGTRYFDNQGETYAKEMAGIMDKIKAEYQSRQQSNTYCPDKGLKGNSGR